jgi:hypothetical protein
VERARETRDRETVLLCMFVREGGTERGGKEGIRERQTGRPIKIKHEKNIGDRGSEKEGGIRRGPKPERITALEEQKQGEREKEREREREKYREEREGGRERERGTPGWG